MPKKKAKRKPDTKPPAKRARAASRPRPRKQRTGATQTQISRHFGVSRRTVSEWAGRGMPGEPGQYDPEAIDGWLKAEGLWRYRRASEAESETARLRRLSAERLELRLHQERGDVVALTPILRLMTRHIHEAKSQLYQLPDELLAELADVVPDERLSQVRQRVRGRVDAACLALADMLRSREVTGVEADGEE